MVKENETGENRKTRGFGDPYKGFDIDPSILRMDLDPRYIDPVDSHVLPDILDDAAIPKDLVNVDELIEIGITYMTIEKFEQAIDSFARAIWFTDDSEIIQEAWINKGVSHSELEEFDEAIGSFKEAIITDPKGKFIAKAENNLAFAMWEFGKDQEAMEHVDRAIDADERFAEAWYNKGFFMNERGLADQALYCLDNAITLGYRGVEVLEEKLRACDSLGDHEDEEERVRIEIQKVVEQENMGMIG
jgi:tetratricopeptide (TPR) repeat protein